jgi:hypothetical protein
MVVLGRAVIHNRVCWLRCAFHADTARHFLVVAVILILFSMRLSLLWWLQSRAFFEEEE